VFYTALQKVGVPAELHIYEQGPHGTGLAQTYPALSEWTTQLRNWLRLHGWLPPQKWLYVCPTLFVSFLAPHKESDWGGARTTAKGKTPASLYSFSLKAGMPFSLPPLYPILDASFLPNENRREFLHQLVSGLADAGVTLLQYRNKQGSETEILADAAIIRAAAGPALKLILNDFPQLAVEAGFDGVHVGQQDMTPHAARAIVGSDLILGISTHNEAQLRAADQEPVDYIAIGPVFATTSKNNPDPVIGLEYIRLVRRFTRKPLVAIGGITLETAASVRAAGADSVAVISAIFSTKEPGRLAAQFLSQSR
jgi:thiamine-phosphate pyrophosphorylase